MTVRILVTVSRSWRSWSVMREALQQVHDKWPDAVLVHGDAPKGDRQAAGMWRELGGEVEAWPAQWTKHAPDCPLTHMKERTCRHAGFRRNVAMVESAPDLVLAFINNRSAGATHCADAAEGAGIPTLRYEGTP
jgi:hypothetical protein